MKTLNTLKKSYLIICVLFLAFQPTAFSEDINNEVELERPRCPDNDDTALNSSQIICTFHSLVNIPQFLPCSERYPDCTAP